MKFEDVKQLVKLLEKSELSEITWKEGDSEILVKRAAAGGAYAVPAAPAPAPAAAPAVVAPEPKAAEAAKPSAGKGLHEICSPMVGTFYRSPSPEDQPYVAVGDHVTKGQVVGIIEAMKLMNEIESDCNGTIAEMSIENETPVEFGAVLFRIKAD